VLESGKRLRYTGEFIAVEKKANAPGGCSLNRTSEKNRQAMFDLRDRHPRYIKLKDEAGAKNQNVEVGVKMTIYFAKAFKENVINNET
jgi:hypothetical protein